MTLVRLVGVAALILVVGVPSTSAGPPATGPSRPGPIGRGVDDIARSLIDRPAPPLPALTWLDGQTRSSKTLAGKVVVIRNFTNGCPFCVTTVPALSQIHKDYGGRGVVVLGVYHPKPPRPVTAEEARGHARTLGATFAVGVDPDWSLVNRWWLDNPGTTWTSVTWVLDRGGRFRFIHPGGEYHPGGGAEHTQCRSDEQALRRTLDRLLAE